MVTKKVFNQRIFSGIQPTGVPHLGNYLGAIANWVRLQDSHQDCLFSIVDLHAITVPQQPSILKKNINEMAMSLIACGINQDKSILFRQSKVHQHSELAWILFCRTPVSWLTRMHQWKTKGKIQDSSDESGLTGPLGLLSYPTLMAADVLLYRGTHVPVGEDQLQHINLMTDIAKSFNSSFKKEVFPIPQGMFTSEKAKRIMSLRDPTSKMSKSDESDASRINLTDSPSKILGKIKKATTDSTIGITYDASRPGVFNLLNILMSIEDMNEIKWGNLSQVELQDAVSDQFGRMGNAEFKQIVADRIVEHLNPIRDRFNELSQDQQQIEDILKLGEAKASSLASRTMRDVYKSVGLP
ncbi:hypothetical protein BC833DRAFT_606967 [Globomyces pollinis-pini]|nr:hypothetical protein BC833DRAFT_606967 [Globomyces pollinis-pini]